MSDMIGRLGVFAELNVPAAELPGSALGLSDASVRDALAGLGRQVATLQSVLAGGRRSSLRPRPRTRGAGARHRAPERDGVHQGSHR